MFLMMGGLIAHSKTVLIRPPALMVLALEVLLYGKPFYFLQVSLAGHTTEVNLPYILFLFCFEGCL